MAAQEHVEDIGGTGLAQPQLSDGTPPDAVIAKQGKTIGLWAMNMSFRAASCEEIIAQQLISDGVPGRNSRENIFNPDLKTVGVHAGIHNKFKTMATVFLSGGFVN